MTYKVPTENDLLDLLKNSSTPLTKRELIAAFNLKGEEQRLVVKRLLKDMEAQGKIVKQPGQAYAVADALPEVIVVEVREVDIDGDVIAAPVKWDHDSPSPRIEINPDGKGHPALAEGDRALVRLKRITPDLYAAYIIRALDVESGRIMGLVVKTAKGYILKPTHRKTKYDFDILPTDLNGAVPGDLAVGEVQPDRSSIRKRVRIREVVGKQSDAKAISLIALHEAGLRIPFPDAVLAETEKMTVPDLGQREDLRRIPLVTIDGADARDFDDAVFAEPCADGGYHLIVAIADVAYYVRPNSALDREAQHRGNSTYFPDRVVPMLPERLSNDLCSLRPHEPRACMAFHLWIDGGGQLQRYKIVRGLMSSYARLTYEQVQAAHDGITDDITGPLLDDVIRPLYAAYAILDAARGRRGALDLNIPERKIVLNDRNEMVGVAPRARLDSHKLIEEFMVLANVAAAQALEAKKAPCVYRVHDRPAVERLDNVREFIESFGLSLPAGPVTKPAQINALLVKANDMEYGHLVHEMLLRAQMQAHYHPDNIGHFGLALQRYAHFTSPIRRYADLIVHRSLIRSYGLGPGGLSDEEEVRLEEICDHISGTERISAEAERNAVDRFAAAFLSQHVGATFTGRISGVTSFGLFVKLEESGVDGLVPIRSLPDDYYIHDDRQHALIGRRNRLVYRLGASVRVAVIETDPLTGSTIFEILDRGADIPGLTLKMPDSRAFAGRRRGKGGSDRGAEQRSGRPRGGPKGAPKKGAKRGGSPKKR